MKGSKSRKSCGHFLETQLKTVYFPMPECTAENTVLLLMLPLFYLELLKLSIRSPITCTHSFLSIDSLRYTLC